MSFDDFEHRPFLEERDSKKTSFEYESSQSRTPATNYGMIKALTIVAVFSTLGNLLWAIQTIRSPSAKQHKGGGSLYAGLERDTPTPFRDDTIFSPNNRSLSDAAWDNWVVDPGIVALPHDWVKAKMLPRAQHWPWDGDKGVYLLNGFHNIHCLQLLRKTIVNMADGRDIEDEHYHAKALGHNLHCIESLRQDALCHADDTPRYSGYSKKEASGIMQTRMCRSWDKLEAWARDHTACYRDVGRDVEGFPMIDKFKFCPPGYIFSATGSPMAPWDTGSGISRPGDE